MTLHTIESWDHCVNDTTAFVTKNGWGPGAFNTPIANSGANRCAGASGNFDGGNRYFEYNLEESGDLGPESNVIVGFNVYAEQGKTAWFRFSGAVGAGEGEHIRINRDGTDENLDVYIGAGTTFVASTAVGSHPTQQWIYMEIQLISDDRIKIWQDDVLVLDESISLPVGGAPGTTRVHLSANNAADWGYVDDLYIVGGDDEPRLGPVGVNAYRPTADGYHTDWTPSVGSTNFDMVNEYNFTAGTGMPNTAKWNETSTDADIDTFVMGWDHHVTDIVAVQWVAYATRTASLYPVIRTGGADTFGPLAGITSLAAVAYHTSMFMENPVTNEPWTWADLVQMEWGYTIDAPASTKAVSQFLVEVIGRRRCGTMRVGSMAPTLFPP